MSRIAKNSIKIPDGISCIFDNNILTVKGKHGEITLKVNEKYTIKNENNAIYVLPLEENNKSDPMWGTTRAHVANSIVGVISGFSKNPFCFSLPIEARLVLNSIAFATSLLKQIRIHSTKN